MEYLRVPEPKFLKHIRPKNRDKSVKALGCIGRNDGSLTASSFSKEFSGFQCKRGENCVQEI
jgi:hypothetical protein